MFFTLRENNLLHTVKRYYRYRDDTNSRLVGSNTEIIQSLNILLTSYPKEIEYNIEIFLLRNEFLDFRFLHIPSIQNLLLGINRKKETKFDISRGNSFTNKKFLLSPLFTSAYSVYRNTNTDYNEKHEINV